MNYTFSSSFLEKLREMAKTIVPIRIARNKKKSHLILRFTKYKNYSLKTTHQEETEGALMLRKNRNTSIKCFEI